MNSNLKQLLWFVGIPAFIYFCTYAIYLGYHVNSHYIMVPSGWTPEQATISHLDDVSYYWKQKASYLANWTGGISSAISAIVAYMYFKKMKSN